MEIKISDKNLGECVITPFKKIGKDEEYIIKSLAVLQILTMNSEEDKEKFKEFVSILKETSQRIEDLYSEEIEANEFTANDQF